MYFITPQVCANDPVWASFTAHVHRVFLDTRAASSLYTLDKHKLSNKHANVCRLHLIGWMPFVWAVCCTISNRTRWLIWKYFTEDMLGEK